MNRSQRRKQTKSTKQNRGPAAERAILAMNARNWPDAVKAYREVLRGQPDNVSAWANLGGAYIELGDAAQAEEALGKALHLMPNSIPVLGNIANLKKQTGDSAGAENYYREILALDPSLARAWQEMAQVKRFVADDPDLEAMRRLHQARTLDDDGRVHIAYALGKALEDAGDYDAAFSFLAEANGLKRKSLRFDIEAHKAAVDALIRVFDSERLARAGNVGFGDERPVFVLGMPRSGTTLVEQILASHHAVHGAGELETLSEMVAKHISGFPTGAGVLAPGRFETIGRDYVRALVRDAGKARRVTDKMPRNFLFIGLIALALPRARIIHCRRSPLDTCLSAFTLHFPRGQEFSYDLAELGAYYRLYRRLMDHWHRVLPGRILDIAYEDVVAEPERKARELIDHCGLEWDEACLDFHRTKRQVMTASATQVREPVHRRSVARWRRFERHLTPLREALGSYADESE